MWGVSLQAYEIYWAGLIIIMIGSVIAAIIQVLKK